MIISLTFRFHLSELSKVQINETIFEQINFTITNRYDTLEGITSVIPDPDGRNVFNVKLILDYIEHCGCHYKVGSGIIHLFIDLDSDKLNPRTKDIIKMYIRDYNLNRLLE
jgi:hypothetical protein